MDSNITKDKFMPISTIISIEAWKLLNSDEKVILVDTRTEDEWKEIGTPKIEGKVFRITSHLKPDMALNPSFFSELEKIVDDKNIKIIFMCKTNGRSSIAAALALKNEYTNPIVMIDGFEGNSVGPGWKISGLPYEMV